MTMIFFEPYGKFWNFLNRLNVIFFYKSGKGDYLNFVFMKLGNMIPKFKDSVSNSTKNGRWKYKEDQYGIVICVFGNLFYEVNALFQDILGPPTAYAEKNTLGYPQAGYYGEKDMKYHLQYSQTKKYVEIVCVGKRQKS